MVDVSEVGYVNVGDEVVILGRDDKNEITAEELAEMTGTINYEIICQFQKRVTIIQHK